MTELKKKIHEMCPDGVPMVAFDSCATYTRGITYNKKQESDPKDSSANKILRANNITLEANSINFNDIKFVKGEVKIRQDQWLKAGDILICAGSGSKEHIGKVAYIEEDIPFSFGGFMAVIRPQSNTISRYLFHNLIGRTFKDYLNSALNSTTINNLNSSVMNGYVVPLPPLPIQQRIVEILDKFTSLVSSLDSEIALRQKQYEYYRNKLLSFEEGEFEWKTLPEISTNCDRQRKPITGSKRIAGRYPYYGASGIVDYVESYIFDGNYLLISEDGANLLARSTPIAFSIEGKNWVNNHAHVLKFENMDTQRIVELYLNSIDLTPWISGAAQPKLNQDNLNKIPIPIPSLDRQLSIVRTLDTFESLLTNLKKERELRQKQYEYYREKLLTFA